jgi:hypothetical protein
MYEVVLLHRLTPELLSPYKAVVIPNIPYVDREQAAALRKYKEAGGKIYTIGSTRELRDLADLQAPASLLEDAQNERGRKELLASVEKLSGEQLMTLPGTKYVAANVVKKTDTGRVIMHFVNYNTPAKNVRVRANLDGVVKEIDPKRIQLLSPDGNSKQLSGVSVRGTQVEFVLPDLDVYNVVTIN